MALRGMLVETEGVELVNLGPVGAWLASQVLD